MIFAFFCLISAQFVMIMSMFFTIEGLFKLAEDDFCRFRRLKSVQEENSLLVPGLKTNFSAC